jgi:outer membrane protein OmpA-like peptidoglycan-associated protein
MYIKIILITLIMVLITSCNKSPESNKIEQDDTTLVKDVANSENNEDKPIDSKLIEYNNKAVKLEQKGKYSEALKYYKKALEIDPKHSTVWLGVGDVYYKQKQLPLSFEAYLHACADQDALKRVKELYHEDRYKTIDDKNQFNEESLSLLLDAKRMNKIDTMLKACLGNTKSTIIISEIKPEIIFRNINFEKGKSTFKDKQAIQSLRKLVAVWNKHNPKHMILIKGHTDSQQYPNDRKNWKLSVDRAFTVSDSLIELKVPRTCIGIAGYGYSIPAKDSNINDFDKNRRVEIEILSRKCII